MAEVKQSSSSPQWADLDTEWEIILSTLYSMFGELPSAPAAKESLNLESSAKLASKPSALQNEELHRGLTSEAKVGASQEGTSLGVKGEMLRGGAPPGVNREAQYQRVPAEVNEEVLNGGVRSGVNLEMLQSGFTSGVDGEVAHDSNPLGNNGDVLQAARVHEEGLSDPTSGVNGEELQADTLTKAIKEASLSSYEKGSQCSVPCVVIKEALQGSVPSGVKEGALEGGDQVTGRLLETGAAPTEINKEVREAEVHPEPRTEVLHNLSECSVEAIQGIHRGAIMEALNGSSPLISIVKDTTSLHEVVPSPADVNAIHNGVQSGAIAVATYGGDPSEHNVGAIQGGVDAGAKIGALVPSEITSGITWVQLHGGTPSGFFVQQQPCASVAGATMSTNCQQGAYFQNQNVFVPVVEESASSLGSFNGKQRTIQILLHPHSNPHVPQPKQKRSAVQKNKPYIRRPPNAFMIFMRENREKITTTFKPKHSVETNTILGQLWRKMPSSEQEVFYQKAAEERRIHAENHPGWSSKDNYGLRRARPRREKRNIAPLTEGRSSPLFTESSCQSNRSDPDVV